MTALTFWMVFGAHVFGPYDTGFRLPTEQACQDIVEVVTAASADAVSLGAPKFTLVLICTKIAPDGTPV